MPESPSEVPADPALRQDHVRYMEGFPQGTFQPEKQLTRAQAAQLVYRLLAQPESGTGDCILHRCAQQPVVRPAGAGAVRAGAV